MKQIKFIMALAAIASAFALLTGCGTVRDNVPATQFKGSLAGKPFEFSGPKDFSAEEMDFTATTNGDVSAHFKNIKASVNPDVISMTGEAYAKMRAADTQFATGLISAGGQAAGQAAAAATTGK